MTDNALPQYAGGFFYDPEAKIVLLHLRDANTKLAPGKWSFFGGLCEGDETPEEGFMRELKEELNIDVDKTEIVHLRSYLNEKLKTYRHAFYIERKVPVSALVLGEGAGFGWISLEKVFSYDLSDKVRDDLTFFVEQKL